MQLIRLCLIATTAVIGFSSVALSLDGRNAVNQCINRGPACTYTVGVNGEIFIRVGGELIYCDGAEYECSVLRKQKKGSLLGNNALDPKVTAPMTALPGN